MRLLGIDFETTGLDPEKDRVTEMGLVLWDVEKKQPLMAQSFFFYEPAFPEVSADITRLTGITRPMLEEFGYPPPRILMGLVQFCEKHKVEYVVAHNGENFDKPFLMAELDRHSVPRGVLGELPWIDTRSDIPFPTEPDSRKLKHLALDCGFINPFAHRALFDVLTMMRILSHYDIHEVLAFQKIPWAVVRALVNFDNKDLAKAQRYSWEKVGDVVKPKCWIKKIKENKMDDEIEACKKAGFEIARVG